MVQDLKDFFPDENITGLVMRRRKTSSASIDLDEGGPTEEFSSSRRRGSSTMWNDLGNQDTTEETQEVLQRSFRRRSAAVDTFEEESSGSPYKMRLSVIEATEGLAEIGQSNQKRKTSSSSNLPSINEKFTAPLWTQNKSIRKNSEQLPPVIHEPVIRFNLQDVIFKKKRGHNSRLENKYGFTHEAMGYLPKTEKSNQMIKFTSSILLANFYKFFDVEDGGEQPLLPGQLLSSKEIDLSEIYLDIGHFPKKFDNKQKRFHKRFSNNSQKPPADFLPTLIQSEYISSTTFSGSSPLRRKPPQIRKFSFEDSPNKPDDTQKSKLNSKENEEQYLWSSGSSEEEEPALELKRLHSVGPSFKNKTYTMTTVNISSGPMWTHIPFNAVTPEQSRLPPSRIQSSHHTPTNMRHSMPGFGNYKPSRKFTVLEHKVKVGAILGIMVLFKESTTLKIKVCPSVEGYFDRETHDNDNETGRKLSENATSVTSMEEAFMKGNGRFRIVETRPLMFARDTVKKRIFEFALEYVKRTFFYDNLQKYLELVDTIVADLNQFYSFLLKLLDTNSSQAEVEESTSGPCFVISGKFKKVPTTIRADFLTTPKPQESVSFASKKLPTTQGQQQILSHGQQQILRIIKQFFE